MAADLRGAHFLRLLLGAAFISIPVGLAAAGFVGAYKGLSDLLWDSLPDALGVDPHAWWPLVPTLAGGLAVGLLIRYLPGHGGPHPADGHGVGGDKGAGLIAIPGLLIVAAVSLAAGASLGPEMPLMAAVVALGGITAVALRLPQEMIPPMAIAAVAALFGGIFGSPLLGAVLLLDMPQPPQKPGEAPPDRYQMILPAMVGSTVGYLVFLAVMGGPYASYDLPSLGGLEAVDLLWALGIGVAGAIVGLAFIRLFRFVDARVRDIDRPVLLAVAGGLVMGLIAIVVGEKTLFSGEHELQELIDHPESFGVLLALAAGKMVALTVALATGFRGGRVFPLLFIGGALGLALSAVTSVPTAVSLPCGMLAVSLPAMRMPVVMILIVAFFTGVETLPLVIFAGVAAYLICHDQPELRDPPQPVPAGPASSPP